MAPEKQVKEGMLSGMPPKQKIMIVAMVIIILVIIWQVVGLMGNGSSAPPVTKPAANQAAKSAGAVPSPAGMHATSPVNNQATQQTELKQAQVASDTRFSEQQVSEQKYLSKINDLEDLKIQRAIAETNQAIATARLATVTAEKSISDLLTKPVAPEVPAGVYANKLTNPNAPTENASGLPGQLPPGVSNLVSSPSQAEYTVISVSMQLGRWNAVIGYQGKLYSVVIGDVLPADNSVVASINKSGVILKKEGRSRKISIMSAI